MPDWGPVATVVAALIVLSGTVATVRAGRVKDGNANNQESYDQLQEDLESLRGEVTKLSSRLDTTQAKLLLALNHINELRANIWGRGGEPPPPLPDELLRF